MATTEEVAPETPVVPLAQAPEPFDDLWREEFVDCLDLVLWEHPDFQQLWREPLRELQHTAGDLPIMLRQFEWTPLADAILEEALLVSTHGVSFDALPDQVVTTLLRLRDELRALPPLSGAIYEDTPRILAALHAEQGLVHLWAELTQLLGAAWPTPGRSVHGMKRLLVEALIVWRDEPGLARTLAPPMHGYERLRSALIRYESIAQRGGFEELDDRKLKRSRPKRKHRSLADLRRRLAQEDPYVEPEGDVWDDDLTLALRRVRGTYQLRQTGPKRKLIDEKLLKQLNVPVENLIRTLKGNLERWRRSDRRLYDYAIQVNLPDYHGELWDGGERLRRFKVVIGNTRKTKTGVMVNATPLLTSSIRTVIFNPYWNVPERILNEELVPDAHRALDRAATEQEGNGEVVDRENLLSTESTVEYFNTHGYEVLNQSPSGRLWIRQLPGPANALGKVKFIFDNRDSVFMHDTPSKGKFRFPRRAFSHGCMRVHQPVELARLILERDGSWSAHRRRVGLRSLKTLVIPMKAPLRLVVDYITNRVSDDGRVHWLHDVYRHDAVSIASR